MKVEINQLRFPFLAKNQSTLLLQTTKTMEKNMMQLFHQSVSRFTCDPQNSERGILDQKTGRSELDSHVRKQSGRSKLQALSMVACLQWPRCVCEAIANTSGLILVVAHLLTCFWYYIGRTVQAGSECL